jgi:protease II
MSHDEPPRWYAISVAKPTANRYLKLGDWSVSPDGTYIALLLDDDNGSERFTLPHAAHQQTAKP